MTQIQKSYEKLQKKALKHIEVLAKRRLKSNKNLLSFVMKQQTYYFTYINGEIIWDFDYKELHDFFEKWDNILQLTWKYKEIKLISK